LHSSYSCFLLVLPVTLICPSAHLPICPSVHLLISAHLPGLHYQLSSAALSNDKTDDAYWFAEHIFEELDAPNEWYLDQQVRRLQAHQIGSDLYKYWLILTVLSLSAL
jgi:hypothetical protein